MHRQTRSPIFNSINNAYHKQSAQSPDTENKAHDWYEQNQKWVPT